MSISGIDASSASNVWAILKQLGSSSSSGTSQSSTGSDFSVDSSSQSRGSSESQSTASSGGTNSLSSEMMTLLMMIQQSTGAGSDTASSASRSDSAAASTSGISTSSVPPPPLPAGNIASEITSKPDSDGSGGISKTEMETFAQSSGGTPDEADQIFNSLDADSDGSVSANEIANGMKRLMETMQASMANQTSSQVSVTA